MAPMSGCVMSISSVMPFVYFTSTVDYNLITTKRLIVFLINLAIYFWSAFD